MKIGAVMFFTAQSMRPAPLAEALEARGFESLWVPEHTHIPSSRSSAYPAAGGLVQAYYELMDPFLVLSSAAQATRSLKVGTGIALVIQRDPIVTAKLVSTIDQLSAGRFLFGVGNGWNQDEIENHGTAFKTRHKLARERIEAMKAIWTEDEPEYHGEFVDFGPSWSWPKPVQQPRVRTLVGGGAHASVLTAVVASADGWIPIGGGGLSEALPRLHALAEKAGRDPAELDIVPFGTIADQAKLEHYCRLGVDEVVLRVRAGTEDDVLAQLDALAPLVPFAATLEQP